MPLPIVLLGAAGAAAKVAAAAAAAGGIGAAIHGGKKIKDANDSIKAAQARHDQNIARYHEQNEMTTAELEKLGRYELNLVRNFQTFASLFEKIQNRPEFGQVQTDGVALPRVELDDLRVAAGNANLALGKMTAGTLAGVAATNVAIGAIGGLVGGPVALVSLGGTVSSILTWPVGVLTGGLVMNASAGKQQKKADEAWAQVHEAEATIDKICIYLIDLRVAAQNYGVALGKVNKLYAPHLKEMVRIINTEKRLDWDTYTEEEQLLIENTVTLTRLLFKMCQVQLVLKTDDPNGINKINSNAIAKVLDDSDRVMKQIGVAAAVPQQRETGTQAVAFRPYTGSNAEYLKYLINYQTGMDLRQAAELIRTGGTVSVRDAGSFTKELERLGVEVTSAS